MIYTPAYNAFSFTQKTQRTVLVNKDLAKAEKGVGALLFPGLTPLFCCPAPFQYCYTLLFNALFAVFCDKSGL